MLEHADSVARAQNVHICTAETMLTCGASPLPFPDQTHMVEGSVKKEGREGGEGEGWRRREGGWKGGRTEERSEQEGRSEEEVVQLHRALGLTHP